MLSPGEQADSRYFMPLLDQISLPGGKGRPRKRCRYVLADKGYEPLDHVLGRPEVVLQQRFIGSATLIACHCALCFHRDNQPYRHAQLLLDQVRISDKPGRPRKRSRWLLADKGYDA
jgi:hypothetical protein